jgi:hypothetical protein
MPNPKDVDGYIYVGHDDREGMICHIIDRVRDPDILLDIGPVYHVRWGDGTIELVPNVMLCPWFAT